MRISISLKSPSGSCADWRLGLARLPSSSPQKRQTFADFMIISPHARQALRFFLSAGCDRAGNGGPDSSIVSQGSRGRWRRLGDEAASRFRFLLRPGCDCFRCEDFCWGIRSSSPHSGHFASRPASESLTRSVRPHELQRNSIGME